MKGNGTYYTTASDFKSQFVEMFGGKPANGTIADLVCKNISNVKKTHGTNDKIEYIDISSINADNHTVEKTTQYTVKDAPSRAQQCVQLGDLLVSTVRPINKNIAVVNLGLKNLYNAP